MSIETFFNEEIRIIEAEISGVFTYENGLQLIDEMVKLTIKYDTYKWLADYSNANFELGTFEIYHLPKAVYNKLECLGNRRDSLKRAVVRLNDKEDFDFLYSVAIKDGQNLKMFDNRTEAMSWLTDS
jgi:hypothetical protein